MTKDRDGIKLSVGDNVEMIPAMGVDGIVEGVIWEIDGEDVYVDINGVTVHRYGNEMWRIPDIL